MMQNPNCRDINLSSNRIVMLTPAEIFIILIGSRELDTYALMKYVLGKLETCRYKQSETLDPLKDRCHRRLQYRVNADRPIVVAITISIAL